LIFLNFSGNMG